MTEGWKSTFTCKSQFWKVVWNLLSKVIIRCRLLDCLFFSSICQWKHGWSRCCSLGQSERRLLWTDPMQRATRIPALSKWRYRTARRRGSWRRAWRERRPLWCRRQTEPRSRLQTGRPWKTEVFPNIIRCRIDNSKIKRLCSCRLLFSPLIPQSSRAFTGKVESLSAVNSEAKACNTHKHTHTNTHFNVVPSNDNLKVDKNFIAQTHVPWNERSTTAEIVCKLKLASSNERHTVSVTGAQRESTWHS